jgi:hypothetical protein
MAKLVLVNAMVLVNANDLSNHVQSVDIEGVRTEVDVTSMGDTNSEIVLGLGDVTVTVVVFNDYAAASLDSILFPLWQTNTPFPIEIRPVNAARSTSNPAYTMTALLPTYAPINGAVGAAVTTSLAFRNAAQVGLQRLTA